MQSNLDRIHQFLPYDALNGIFDMASYVENNKDKEYLLKKKINSLKINDKVIIKFYYDLDYYESMGIITKIEKDYIYFMESKIAKEDIIEVEYIYI